MNIHFGMYCQESVISFRDNTLIVEYDRWMEENNMLPYHPEGTCFSFFYESRLICVEIKAVHVNIHFIIDVDVISDSGDLSGGGMYDD
jgi:hypothetical protein